MSRPRLKFWLAMPVTIVVFLLLVVSIVADVWLQNRQSEEALHEQAYILSEQMQAVWDFMAVNQDRINTDADGDYNFKGLHCSIVGTSVGALFTDRTDYVIRYVSDMPRNEQNRADEFEEKAIAAFRQNGNLINYASFGTIDNGEEYYRFMVPLKMTSGCEECHGNPAGEVDVTGFPKEGMKTGDIVGVASISIPTDTYRENLITRTLLRTLLSVAVLAACLLVIYCVSMRFVVHPLGKFEAAIRKVGAGDLKTRIDAEDIHAKGELENLSDYFNEMAEELDSLRLDLETKVDERTEQLADANNALARQARELEKVNSQLQADDKYKTHYFTMMSHELRTPLTAIRAHIGILKDPDLDENKRQEVIRSIQANTMSLAKLVNNILDSAKFEVGAIKLEKEAIDASDLVNQLEKVISPLVEAKDMRTSYSVDDEMPLFMGDEDKLLHILENLCANAVKYSEDHGSIWVNVYQSKDGKSICFDVSDEGVGISEEDLGIVFEKFKQGEKATARPVSGRGLGLSLAKEYAELHGGKITVRSKEGEGSIFKVAIPYEEPDFDIG